MNNDSLANTKITKLVTYYVLLHIPSNHFARSQKNIFSRRVKLDILSFQHTFLVSNTNRA